MFKKILGIVAALVLFPAFAATSIDFEGTEFGMVWDESTGAVEGYKVFVSRNGGEFQEEATVTPPTVLLGGEVGDVMIVKVQAFNGTYVSEFSIPSDPVRLVTNAPGAFQLICPDPADELQQIGPDRFRCAPPAP